MSTRTSYQFFFLHRSFDQNLTRFGTLCGTNDAGKLQFVHEASRPRVSDLHAPL